MAKLVTSMSPDRGAVTSAANRAAASAKKLLDEIEAAQYDQARTQRLLVAIANDGDTISRQGERSAEQAFMSVDSLYIAGMKAGAPNTATRAGDR